MTGNGDAKQQVGGVTAKEEERDRVTHTSSTAVVAHSPLVDLVLLLLLLLLLLQLWLSG